MICARYEHDTSLDGLGVGHGLHLDGVAVDLEHLEALLLHEAVGIAAQLLEVLELMHNPVRFPVKKGPITGHHTC